MSSSVGMMNSQYMENKYDVPNHQPEMDFPSKKNEKILQKQQNPIFLKVPPKKNKKIRQKRPGFLGSTACGDPLPVSSGMITSSDPLAAATSNATATCRGSMVLGCWTQCNHACAFISISYYTIYTYIDEYIYMYIYICILIYIYIYSLNSSVCNYSSYIEHTYNFMIHDVCKI